MQRLMWVFPISVLSTLMAEGTKVDVDVKRPGIALGSDRVVVGALDGLRVTHFDPVREGDADGVAIVYNAVSMRVVGTYILEFERLGLVRTSRVDAAQRTTLTYRDAARTFRTVFTNRGRETEVRVFVT
jgi:hypothetical protein